MHLSLIRKRSVLRRLKHRLLVLIPFVSCDQSFQRFLIWRERGSRSLIKLTKPLDPVKSQSLHENDKAFYDQDKDVADYCSQNPKSYEQSELEFEVRNIQRPDP